MTILTATAFFLRPRRTTSFSTRYLSNGHSNMPIHA